ncbi:MAG: hypothetical protein KIT72_03995 [Polyangiaceae bacterium]|nr:hypothetical protein [Polyangiaceae bacterium]MCW5789565.1 hypothetical protein [Polyangiaceae bacterium]
MTRVSPHPDALLCALVLAPATFSRNRFYHLYEGAEGRRVRRRARRLRGLIRQLLGQGRERAELLGRIELSDGAVLLRFRVENLAYQRSTSLSPLEASLVSYALSRAGEHELEAADRERVEASLARLRDDFPELDLPAP